MSELFAWLGQMENSKTVALLMFFPLFCAILIYLFGSRRRTERLESYRFIPLDDEAEAGEFSFQRGDGE